MQLDDAASRYVILKCEGRTQPVVTSLDAEVQAELEDQIKRQKTQEQVAIIFDNLKKETRVDNYYTGESTGGAKSNNVARPDGTKQTIRQTSAQGTTTNKVVKPASTNSREELDVVQPATRPTPKRSTTPAN